MKLRDYQQKAEDSIFKSWADGNKSVVGRMFTGGGKTVVFASVIKRLGKRAMVLAHRKELIWQAKDKIERVTGLRVDVEMGDYKASVDRDMFHPTADVIVSSIQTQTAGGDGKGRMSKFDPMDFGLVIIDEAHHSPSPSYMKVLQYYRNNPDLVILGVTATPDRADEAALGKVFEDAPEGFDYNMEYGVKQGWLAPIRQLPICIESLDFSAVHTTAGDLNQNELAAVMEAEKPLYGIADSAIQIIGDKRGIGFSPSVIHAKMMADIFNRYRPGMAAFVSGDTDPEERKKINSDFSAGKIQAIWNCGTHTEGFDDSGVEWVIPKPTKVRALMEQMVGRGTRPHESIAHSLGRSPLAATRRSLIGGSRKPECLILDYYGNSGKHKMVTAAHILSGNYTDEVVEEVIREARQSGKSVRVDKSLEEVEKKLEEKKLKEQEEAARKANLTVKASFRIKKEVDPFDVLDLKPVASRAWDANKVLSERCRNMLQKHLHVDPDKVGYTKGMQLVKEQIRRWDNKLCSIGQAKVLKKYGLSTEMKYADAKAAIDAIAKNGWRKPSVLPNAMPNATVESSDEILY